MIRLCWVALAAAVMSAPLVAQAPPDAAIFAHVNVAKLWAGPVGEQLRAAKVPEFDRAVRELEVVTGLTPADITSATIYWPDLRNKDLGVFPPFVMTLTLAKPLDAGRIVALAAVGCRASGDELAYTFEKDLLTLKSAADSPPRRRRRPVSPIREVTLDVSDPLRPRLAVNSPAKPGAVAANGPLSPALLAATTKDVVVGVNAAKYERREQAVVDASDVAYLALRKADTALVVADVAGGKLTVEARLDIDEPADRRDAVKALEVVRTQFGELIAAGLKWTVRSKDPADKPLVPLLEALKAGIEAATVRTEGSEAVATLSVRADLPFAVGLAAAVRKDTLDARDRTVSQNNLKQLGIAMHGFHDATGALPAAATADENGKPLLSWRVAVLPFVEQGALHLKFKLDEPWDSAHNLKVLKDNPMPGVFGLPGVTKDGDKETHSRVFVGNGAAFDPAAGVKMAGFTDGTSNTLLVVTAAKAVPWTKPDELDFEPDANAEEFKKPFRFDGNGCNVLLADGTVKNLRYTVTAATLKALVTRAGGEVTNLD